MGIGLRSKHLLRAGGIGAGIMLVVSGVTGYFVVDNVQEKAFAEKQAYKKELQLYENEAHSNQLSVSLKENVKKGQKITRAMVQEVYVPRNASGTTDTVLTMKSISNGKYFAKTDMSRNTQLSTSVLYKNEDISNDLREAEYAFIELPSDLKKNQYIDVRIQFPNGEDYVLLGKKKAKNILGVTTWIDIDEGEILTMSSAIVDAYLEGARIYALKYVDEHMQQDSQMTYPVKENVMELIKENPNIVNRAKLNLENQNRTRLENSLNDLSAEEKDGVVSGNSRDKANAQAANEKSAEEKLQDISDEANSGDQEELVKGTATNTNEGE